MTGNDRLDEIEKQHERTRENLKYISKEIDELIYENGYLKAENEALKERIKEIKEENKSLTNLVILLTKPKD